MRGTAEGPTLSGSATMDPTARTISPDFRMRAGTVLLALVVLFVQSVRADNPPHPRSSGVIEKLVARLSNPDYRERVDAEKELAEIAETHVPELAQAAERVPDEAGHRLLHLLELVLLKRADETGDAAERALQRLREDPGPIGVAAGDILLGNARLIETRAREAIRNLGGAVVYHSPESFAVYRSKAVAAGTGAGFGEIGVLQSVWLYDDWKGGTEGLWHIRRLSHVPDLVIYTMSGNGLDPQTILAAAGPAIAVHVEQRGGCLGIRGRRNVYHCVVEGVIPGSAADRAGLQEGDVITKLNSATVRSFDELVEMLKVTSAGDTIELNVVRSPEVPHPFDEPPRPLENESKLPPIKVKLGSWKEAPHGEQEMVRPPSGFGGPYGPPLGDRLPPPPGLPEAIERGPTEWRRL